MSEQPPVPPPNQPPHQQSNQPAQGNPPTQPMPAAPGPPLYGTTAGPAAAYPPKATVWHQATSTSGRRWGLGIAAGALALLLLFGFGVAGLLVLRNHDRVDLLGNRGDGQFLRQDGSGNGRGNGNGKGDGKGDGKGWGPGAKDDKVRPKQQGIPGTPDGRAQGLGGLGSLLGGTALHGEVTANANGSVQALAFQRGEVTAVSDTSVTLKSSDDFVGTYGRTGATVSRGAALVKGGQAFVLARASDKVAITTMALSATAGVAPSN